MIVIFTSSCEKKTNMENQGEISSSQEKSRQDNSSEDRAISESKSYSNSQVQDSTSDKESKQDTSNFSVNAHSNVQNSIDTAQNPHNVDGQIERSEAEESSSLEQSSDNNIDNNRLTQNQALDLVMDAVKGLDIYKDSDLIYACEEKVINDKDYFMFQYCYIEHSESNPMDSVTDIAYFFVNQQNGELYYTNSDLLFNDIKKFIPGTTQFIRLRQFS